MDDMLYIARRSGNRPRGQLRVGEAESYRGYLITKGFTNYSISKNNTHVFSATTLNHAKEDIDMLVNRRQVFPWTSLMIILTMFTMSGCQHVLYFGGTLENVCINVVDIGNSSTLTPTLTVSGLPGFGAAGPTDTTTKEELSVPNAQTLCRSVVQPKK